MAMFATVVKKQSFTAAADEIGIAKSAVSKRIAELEERVGVRLLTRTTRKLSLTEEGVRYYEHCAALLNAARAAEASVADAGAAPRGPLRVNAPVTFAQMFLARALARFLEHQPAVEIELSTDDRIVDVVDGGYDVVIRICAELKVSSLVVKKLAGDRLVVCGTPRYLDARGRPEKPGDLVNHNCLHYSLVGREAEWRFRGATGPLAIPTIGNLNAGDGTVLRQAALAHLGLVVLPHFMVAGDVERGDLELVLDGRRRAEIGIYAVFASRRHLPARTKALLDHLGVYFSAADWRTTLRTT
jgi:DNA-binding transcriptional LysR family regulator